jgi:hypothetical protein
MDYLKIKNVSLRIDILENSTKDEAVQIFKNVNQNIVIEAWNIVHPNEKPKKKRKSRVKKD